MGSFFFLYFIVKWSRNNFKSLIITSSLTIQLFNHVNFYLALKECHCHVSAPVKESSKSKFDVAAETQFQLGGLNLEFKCRISFCQLWYMKWRKILVSATATFSLLFLEFHYNLNYIQAFWNRRKTFSHNLTSAKSMKL